MAGDLVLIILEVKLVIIRQLEQIERGEYKGLYWGTALRALPNEKRPTYLFTLRDPATRNDDDLVLFIECHHFRHTVGCTRMIDITRETKKS